MQLGYPEAKIVLDVPQPVKGEWDILRVEQMITNLIINGIRHGEPGGIVHVKLAEEDNRAVVSVHNGGSPIPEEIQKKIFNSGFSGSNGQPGKEKSYGLGLLIVKEIVEGHEGDIDVQSNREEGTTFTVRLPLEK